MDTIVTEKVVLKSADSTDDNENKSFLNQNQHFQNEAETLVANADIDIIHATVVFNESPCVNMNNNCLKSIIQMMDSKEHLQRNLPKVKFGKVRKWNLENAKFKHEMDMVIHVKKSYLWEPARKYLWRHLGTSSWNLTDGTEVSFVRIHKK